MNDIKKAEKDYLKGMKYKDIAKKYNVSLNTVKSWVRRYNWAEKKKGAHKEDVCTPKKRGAPKGNKNAIGNSGGGAPKGNKNAVTTGEFERLFFSDLTNEEKELINSIEYDKKILLQHEIALLTVREKRILQRIEEAKNKTGGLSIKDVTTRKTEITGNLLSGKQKQNETITHALSTFELISRLEEALTRIQSKKIKCIDSLNKIEIDEKRLQLEERKLTGETEQDKLVDEWIDSVLGDKDE
ncbi:phage terminase small subunit [Caloranaerobacter azorensis]|uniref:Helix-turn-helix domain-containing protein n=1 Tax=Caloranaerobacter azorensis TaxID=116090 RepID=A0A6P1YAL8_9FIRM|nr:phage terminase small subunit [Caloranaerobacter azorensis]QIB26087.1 helix-turn-helix domain-containing protein [Caloranaerobacter azorensis]